MRPPTAPAGTGSGEIFPWIVAAAAGMVVVVWAGGLLASFATGTVSVPTVPDAGEALVRLVNNLAEPKDAWPPTMAAAMPGAVVYWICQVVAVALVGATAGAVRAAWRAAGSDRPKSMGLDTDAGLARRRDLRTLRISDPTEGRITIGRARGALLACEPEASLAVVGPTGCGKTAGFAIPALLEWRGPVLATSVKADLMDATIGHRRERGQVWTYDPTLSARQPSNSWSPLAACDTWAGALRVASWMVEAAQPKLDSVTDADYWYSQARKGIAPYLHAAALSDVGIADLATWIDTQEEAAVERTLRRSAVVPAESHTWDELWDSSVTITRELLLTTGGEGADLAEKPTDAWPTWLLDRVTAAVEDEWRIELDLAGDSIASPLAALTSARALWRKEPRLKGSVFATMENVLSTWGDPGVCRVGAANDIDLDLWLSGDNTIYVVAPAHEQARLRPVLTVLVQQVIRHAYEQAARNGGALEHGCLVLLDEAGNIAPLRDLPGYASTARSHRITFVTVWQDLAQIRALYRDRADTVLNNHRAKLFGAGIADAGTLDYISRLVGDEIRTERNVSSDIGSGRRSVSEHHTYRRAAPADIVRRIRSGEGLLVYGRELPAHVRLRPWFADRRLRALGLISRGVHADLPG